MALDHDERPRLQKDLGNKNHMLLRNHGTLTVGRSVASAFERMFHLERACTMQVRTRMLGPTAYPVEQAVIDTLAVDTEAGCVEILWRASRPVRRNLFEIAQVLVGRPSAAWWRARQQGKDYYPSLAALAKSRQAAEERD